MSRCLEGKVVAITGAGRGIGRELALHCAAQGAAILVNDPGVAQAGDGSDAVKQAARARGCVVLTKPVKPAALRAFLSTQRGAH